MISKMSKPSQRILEGFIKFRFHSNYHPINPSNGAFFSSSRDPVIRNSSSFSSSSRISRFQSDFPANPISSNLGLSQILHGNSSLATKRLEFSKLNGYCFTSRFRFFSVKTQGFGSKINGNFTKKVLEKPSAAISSTFSRYRGALGLQIEAFFRRYSLVLVGAGGIVVCALLWRIMFGIANTFVGLSEGMAKYGFLALSSAIVAFAGLYLRSRFMINPDKVYRMAMRKLNTSAGILEVMGAPLSGSDLRAYVMSGGGLTLKNFKLNRSSKRCFLIFPIRGSERKGLVSVEVKKKKGQYDMKLLAVDIPMASGPDQRLYLIGDEEEYKVGGGLISELRDPVVKAMAATKEFDDLDQIEEKEDAARELQEAERKRQEEIEKLEKSR